MSLTAERLREVLRYDPDTGKFTWIKATGKKSKPGKAAGYKSGDDSYCRILLGIDGKRYRAHRLAWLYMNGQWPRLDVDHINGDATDNRWANLREATKTQNMANSRRYKNNASGIKGVHFHRQSGKWRAVVRIHNRNQHVGLFTDKFEAGRAYFAAAQRLFGEFATSGERAPPSASK